jgi:hypothetical protein
MLRGVPFLIGGLLWGAFFLFALTSADVRKAGDGSGFLIAFFSLFCFPTWASILYMGWLWLARHRTFYAFSDRRLMIRTGAVGTDINTFDYGAISNLRLSLGPIESRFGVGSITFNTGEVTRKGFAVTSSFHAISDPVEVFRKLKEVSLNVKTDENYPNANRPAENPGYKTHYKPE